MTVQTAELLPLEELFVDHFKWHSSYQIDHFIIGTELTIYGTYKQALRETHKRARLLRWEILQRMKCHVDVMELEKKTEEDKESSEDVFGAMRRSIELKEKQEQLKAMDFALEHRQRELARFWAHASVLKSVIGEIDDTRRHKLERELWLAHMRVTLLIDMYRDNAPSRNVLEALITLPAEDRKQITNFLAHMRDRESLAGVMADEQARYRQSLPNNLEALCRDAEAAVDHEELLEMVKECPLLSLEIGPTPSNTRPSA